MGTPLSRQSPTDCSKSICSKTSENPKLAKRPSVVKIKNIDQPVNKIVRNLGGKFCDENTPHNCTIEFTHITPKLSFKAQSARPAIRHTRFAPQTINMATTALG